MRSVRSVKKLASAPYAKFDSIDGSHRFKDSVAGGFVEYSVRTRFGAQVFYLNFDLAREMGLIPSDHPDVLTPELAEAIIHTFSLVIINEWDLEQGTAFRKQDIRKNKYMATRYLQLQHPNKRGRTSGDGRGIWNGELRHRGSTWDISSSGTGATCLSPAVAIEQKFFKTGGQRVCYGNGRNSLDEAIPAALMSEIFHRQGISTERTLVILSFEDGTSINVRASKNLLRPAHFFCHLKQGNYAALKTVADFHIERERENGRFPERAAQGKYWHLAEQAALAFARASARFESDYIFCWMDWDGDNILADGGIIDYGSIRQFGLYHWQYRYDDVNRMSTTIPEQRIKASYIVQNFIQIADFLTTGSKKNIQTFRNHPLLKLFDDTFERARDELLLVKMGFRPDQAEAFLGAHPRIVRRFRDLFSYFERARSSRGIYEVADGVTCDAIFSMRNILRGLPKLYLETRKFLDAKGFIDVIKSSEASRKDLRVTWRRWHRIRKFQETWLEIFERGADRFASGDLRRLIADAANRTADLNRSDRITGDAAITLTNHLIRQRRGLTFAQRFQIMHALIEHQSGRGSAGDGADSKSGLGPKAEAIFRRHLAIIEEHREGF